MWDLAWVTDPSAWAGLGTLILLEVVLGIDNVIFLSILAGKLPREQQQRARTVGLLAAMLMRLALLFSIRLRPVASRTPSRLRSTPPGRRSSEYPSRPWADACGR